MEPMARATPAASERAADQIAARATSDPPDPVYDGPRRPAVAGAASAAVPGSGRPLPADLRAHFERRLGWDLSRVDVHADVDAARSAVREGARAYTLGRSVAFAPGEYRPHSADGRHLLAHELAHVVQQGTGAAPPGIQRQASQDWYAVARNMTLHDLEQAVLRLRQAHREEVESSAEGVARVEQLRVYEEVLAERQRPSIAVDEAVAAARHNVRGVLTGTGNTAARTVAGLMLLDNSTDALFVQGFFAGCIGAIPPAQVGNLRTELQEHYLAFYWGYLKGIPVGLAHGLIGLVEGIGMIAMIAFWTSPIGLAVFTGREAYRFLRDPNAYIAARQRDIEQARRLKQALEQMRAEVEADPTVLIQWSAELGTAIGEASGQLVTDQFLRQPIEEKGRIVGDFVGQVLFEVLLEVVLAAVTAGIGNALRATGAAGQGARGGGRLARLLRRLMETSPAIRRLLAAIAGHADTAAELSRAARRGVEAVEETASGVRAAERTAETVAEGARATERTAETVTEGARAVEATPKPPKPTVTAHADEASVRFHEVQPAQVERGTVRHGVSAEASAAPQPARRTVPAEEAIPEPDIPEPDLPEQAAFDPGAPAPEVPPGERLSLAQGSLDSAELARQAGIPDVVLGDGYVYSAGDFPDLVPNAPLRSPRPAPATLPTTGRSIGSPRAQGTRLQGRLVQDLELRADLQLTQDALEGSGARIVRRMNQDQVIAEFLAGRNRPDLSVVIEGVLQDGRRVFIEYDRAPGTRSIPHARRILENDPEAIVILKIVDFD
jgi:hypothetical protein